MDEIQELNEIGRKIAGVENAAEDIGQAFQVAEKINLFDGRYLHKFSSDPVRWMVCGLVHDNCVAYADQPAKAILRACREAVKAAKEEA